MAMMELVMILVGGLLGSAHCVGMCGGFALTIGLGGNGWNSVMQRQLIYSAGRIFTYAFLGIVVGFLGIQFAQKLNISRLQAVLSMVAGVLLVLQGLHAAGMFRWKRIKAQQQKPCLQSTFFSRFLTSSNRMNVFVSGLLTGFLPCGLVYAYLALAASSGQLLSASAIMVTFGLGTVPLMVATGTGGMLVSLTARKKILTVAAWCVVATGALAMWRGYYAGSFFSPESPLGCPLCPPGTLE